MFVEVGIILVTYMGVRFYEKKSNKPKNKKTMVKQPQKAVIDNPNNKTTQLVDNNIEKQHQNYLKLSAVSMGLAAVRQFIYPSLAPLSFALYIYTVLPRIRDVENALVKQRKVNDNVFFFIVVVFLFNLQTLYCI